MAFDNVSRHTPSCLALAVMVVCLADIARLEKGFWTFRALVAYKYISAKTGGK